MNFISLFAGIGGLDLGLERAGMNCVAQVEIDDFCQKVLTKHWADVPKFKDVRDVGKHNLPTADVICGGFPCQPHSYAGKRRGKADDRNLWGEYLRVIDELKPRFVIGENVPGLITTMLDEILSDLEARGYTCQTFIIPAGAFNAPHWRDRVWIIAHNTKNTKSIGRRGRDYGNSEGNIRSLQTERPNPTLHEDASNPHGLGHLHGQSEIITTEAGQYALGNIATACGNVTDANTAGLQGRTQAGNIGSGGADDEQFFGGYAGWDIPWIEVAPALCRVDDGLPRRLDTPRLKALGNAVVPQVAEFIGRCIMGAL